MKKNIFKMCIGYAFWQIFILCALPVNAAKLVIVIDDIGYRKADEEIYALPKEVNVSIIPSAPHATKRAEQAFAQNRDVLIHLPMQPTNPVPIEKEVLKIGMSAQVVADTLKEAYRLVPHAIGLNNHMGGAATADTPLMKLLMEQLVQYQLSFLDSRTAGKSVAAKTARELGISTLERHIFLDDNNELSNVEKQFEAAIQYARHHGVAIMIGHPRKNSIAVLKKGLANLPKDIELVNIGSLWHPNNEKPEPQSFILIFGEAVLTSTPPFQSTPLLRGIPKE